MEDDAELVAQFLKGNRMAGSLLVKRHYAALFGWLLVKTASQEDAEDLVQSVWRSAIPALPQLKNRASLRAWLFSIGQREFLNWLRQRRERPTCSFEMLQEEQNEGWKNEIFDLFTLQSSNFTNAALDRIALQNALAQLSEDHRETFLLRYVSQLSASEVASVLEVPVGTVESRCHFARERLRKALRATDEAHSRGTGLSNNPSRTRFQKI